MEAAEAVAEVAAKEVAALNEVAEVEAMPNEVGSWRWRAAAVAVREVVGADSVADSHLGSRRGTRNAAMPTRSRSVVVPADLALGRVPGPESQDERVAALAAQVGQVLERAARDAKMSALVAQEDRVQSPVVQVERASQSSAAQAAPADAASSVTVLGIRGRRCRRRTARRRQLVARVQRASNPGGLGGPASGIGVRPGIRGRRCRRRSARRRSWWRR